VAGVSDGVPKNLREFVARILARRDKNLSIPEKIPAYTQVIKGTPYSWWDSDQIWYMPQSRRMNAPYGESFIEQAWSWIMIIVNITAFELGHYRTGNMPEGFVTLPRADFDGPDAIMAFEEMFDARMSANPATARMRIRMFPEGTTFKETKKPDFPEKLYSQAVKNVLHSVGIPPSELGDVPGGGLGGKGFKEGAASDLSRNTLNPHRAFVATPFNDTLDSDGVDDAWFELGYPIEEIDPDKQKASAYEGMAHGTLSLNDALAELNMNPIGDPDDRNFIANKHLIVAGTSIFVVEDMDVQNGMAVPTFTPDQAGGTPAGPETAIEQTGAVHTPEDTKTVQKIIRNVLDTGRLDSKFISIPSTVGRSTPVRKVDATHDDGAMVAVFIPPTAAIQLRRLTEELYLPPEAELERPETMHVTLACLTDPGMLAAQRQIVLNCLQNVAGEFCPLENARIQGFGVFNGKAGVKVLFALLDDPQLPFIRTRICEALDAAGMPYAKDYGFVPHVTMAYFPDTFQIPAGFSVPDMPAKIACISLSEGPARADIPLVGIPVSKLAKHCGVCPEDDSYYGAPIAREAVFHFPADGNHVNSVEMVAMTPAGLPAKPALWKPEGGEDVGLSEWIGHPQYVAEEAAYLLDRALGFMLVPVAYVAEGGDGEIGAAIYYTFTASPGSNIKEYDPAWVERAAVFDYITGQTDRSEPGHNYLNHPDDPTRPVLIDNGLSFPADDHELKSPFVDAWAGRPISDETLNAVMKLLGDSAVWADIAALVGTAAAVRARYNAQRLLDERAITPGTTSGGSSSS